MAVKYVLNSLSENEIKLMKGIDNKFVIKLIGSFVIDFPLRSLAIVTEYYEVIKHFVINKTINNHSELQIER